MARFTRTLVGLHLGFVLAAGASPVAAQTMTPPPVLDRELFFGNPEISGAQLSPDGQFIAFIKPYKETRNIWVKRLAGPRTTDAAWLVRRFEALRVDGFTRERIYDELDVPLVLTAGRGTPSRGSDRWRPAAIVPRIGNVGRLGTIASSESGSCRIATARALALSR